MIVELRIEEEAIDKQTMKDLKRLKRAWKMKSVEEVIAFLLEPETLPTLKRKIEFHTDLIFAPKRIALLMKLLRPERKLIETSGSLKKKNKKAATDNGAADET